MLVALLHRKLSLEQENMEDILTSNVFGTFKYLPPRDGLLPFLRRAVFPNADAPLALVSDDAHAAFEFWPWLEEPDRESCEPDVLIRVTGPPGTAKTLILVEAKFRSGKSSEADDSVHPQDQLAREWDNLQALAAQESSTPVLIYVTADMSLPHDDIEASQQELARKRGQRGRIGWLSWRHLPSLLDGSAHEVLRDLGAALRHLNLTFFEGLSSGDAVPAVQWTFTGSAPGFSWECIAAGGVVPAVQWTFTGSVTHFSWRGIAAGDAELWRFRR
jgi:hypothetical protein